MFDKFRISYEINDFYVCFRKTRHIQTSKNDIYVDHYDIMVLGGYHDYIDEEGFRIDNKYGLGHHNAKVLVDGETDNRFGTVAKPAVTLAANSTVGSHDYSIDHWVMLVPPTPTGISDITADGNDAAVYYNLNDIEVTKDDILNTL